MEKFHRLVARHRAWSGCARSHTHTPGAGSRGGIGGLVGTGQPEVNQNPTVAAVLAAAAAPRRGCRLLLRGESAVASAGIALAAILLAVMGASSWWTLR